MNYRSRMLSVFFFVLLAAAAAAPAAQKPPADLYRRGKIKLVPIATIDEKTLPKDVFFQGVVDIKCDPKGNVYVCDYRGNHIKKFDAAGKYLKTIGRQGQGPGEFNMPFYIAVTADRLFVYDMQNNRLCALTLDGTFVKSIPIIIGEGRPQEMSSLPNGDIVIGWEKIFYADRSRPQEYSIRVYTPDLELRKNIFSRDIWRNKYMTIEGLGRTTNVIQPFSPLVSWDVTADGKIVIGFQKDYEIEIHDPAQGKIASYKHPYEPVKVTEKDKETFFGGMTYGSSDGRMMKGAPEPIVKATEFPKEKPPFLNLIADSDGNILVSPYRKNREEEWKTFDAFSPEGTFLGSVRIEGGETLPRAAMIRDGVFWAMKTDDDGLVSLVKYKISD